MQSEVIDGIILIEWGMFQAVNEGGPRASCQDDEETFQAMRRAQFSAWSEDAAGSYFQDLMRANIAGRNLIAEKYIHMMRETAPEEYAALSASIPKPKAAAAELAREINACLLEQTRVLREKYPRVADAGRPLYAQDDIYGTVSVETYQLGELLTYSPQTLQILRDYVLSEDGADLAERILKNTVGYYGYKSLEEAEAKAR